MAYAIQVRVDYYWVADGAGSAMLGQNQSNFAGYGPAQGPGEVPSSQTLRLIQGEQVPGGDSPTQANFNTSLSNAIADLETQMATVGAANGVNQTPLAIIQGWSTGNP